jgi:tetratricopeptide (TPR) repeat protein
LDDFRHAIDFYDQRLSLTREIGELNNEGQMLFNPELYKEEGKYAEAEPLYKRALAITTRVFGKDHSNVATVLENYAELLHKMNRIDEEGKIDDIQPHCLTGDGSSHSKVAARIPDHFLRIHDLVELLCADDASVDRDVAQGSITV